MKTCLHVLYIFYLVDLYMSNIYVPGCALMSYKQHLADKLIKFLEPLYGHSETLYSCCFNKPDIKYDARILTPCVACMEVYEKRGYSVNYVLADIAKSNDFPFPDYGGMAMSIQDTCYARKRPDVHETIRLLLQRMNIRIIEPQATCTHSKCCGHALYGKAATAKVEELMRKRAGEMPCDDVVVYCASCIVSMSVGGKKPHYILDLLFDEQTDMHDLSLDGWNKKLNSFKNQPPI